MYNFSSSKIDEYYLSQKKYWEIIKIEIAIGYFVNLNLCPQTPFTPPFY